MDPEPQGGVQTTTAADTGAAQTTIDTTSTQTATAVDTTATQTATDTTAQTSSTEFAIPEQFAKEKWAENIKTPEDLWNQLSNAQKLIGKKSTLQAPENPEMYEFKSIEPLKDLDRDANVDNKFKQLLHKHNIPKELGEQLVQDYEALVYELQEPLRQQAAEQETKFNELKSEVFGKDADTAIEQFKTVFKESLGDKVELATSILDTLPPEANMALMAFSKKIHDTYVGESRINSDGSSLAGQTQDLKTQFQSLSQQKLSVKTDTTLNKLVRAQKLQVLNAKMREIGQQAAEKNIDLFS